MNDNNKISHYQIKKNDKNKNINFSKILLKTDMNLYDVVEKKDIELKNLKNDTNNIKKDTIKEFIYSNKKIPNFWKNKKNYKNIVLETFVEDDNFLKYLGNIEENDVVKLKIKNKIQIRPKTAISVKKKIRKNLTTTNHQNINQIKNKLGMETIEESFKYDSNNMSNIYSSLSGSNKFKKPKIKIKKVISQQEEIQNMLDNLKEKFPLKNKLKEIYTNYNLKELFFSSSQNKKIINENNKIENINSINKLIDESRFHKAQKIGKNIFNNLLSKNSKEKSREISNEKIYSKNNYINYKIQSKNKKGKIRNALNDSIIYNHLKSTNFYGPYFSYCPFCCDDNIKYYKYMERKQCISLLNYIKKDRNKKMEIEESKFRKKIKLKKNSFLH